MIGLEEPAGHYASMTIPDSIAYPFELLTRNIRTPPTATANFLDGKAFIETFVLTAALGRAEPSARGCTAAAIISADGFTLDGIKRLEDKGVTDVIVGFRIPYIVGPDTEPLDTKIRNREMFAEKIIAKLNSEIGSHP